MTMKKLVNPASDRSTLNIGFIDQLRMELFQSDFQIFIYPRPDRGKLSLELKHG